MEKEEILPYLLHHTTLLSSGDNLTIERALIDLNNRLYLDSDIPLEITERELTALDIINDLNTRVEKSFNEEQLRNVRRNTEEHLAKVVEGDNIMSKYRICPACSASFTSTHGNKKYCSTLCVKNGNRARSAKRRAVKPAIKDISRSYVTGTSSDLIADEREAINCIKKEII